MIYNLVQLLERAASRHDGKDAFKCLEKSVSYGGLNVRSSQLALQLRASGVRAGDRVGIYMNRCLETAVAVYGILKAGAAYVPLDPFAPVLKTAAIIEDCGIEVLLTNGVKRKNLQTLTGSVSGIHIIIGIPEMSQNVRSVSWDAIFETDLKDYEPLGILEHDLALILYTSGSTGRPKGIMHTHHSVLRLAELAAEYCGMHESDVMANPAPLHFDPSTFGYFSVPLVGATTIIVPDAYLKLPASLSTLLEEEKVTLWYSVPLMLVQLLQRGVLEKRNLKALRWVLFAGEVFVTKHLRNLMRQWPQARFANLYGPTETNVCTWYTLDGPPEENAMVPIGRVWGNTDYMIVDENDTPVSPGDAGELLIRSATLMRGYWNDESLTERSIYQETVAPGYRHRYYRTGDLVREDENGELLFLGRNDRQIKLRGYRIELDEIEAVILKNDRVEEVAVTVSAENEEVPEIVAFVRPTLADPLDVETVKRFCATQLPAYSVPATVRIVSDFPRTSSGKIDRRTMAAEFKALEETHRAKLI